MTRAPRAIGMGYQTVLVFRQVEDRRAFGEGEANQGKRKRASYGAMRKASRRREGIEMRAGVEVHSKNAVDRTGEESNTVGG